MPGRGEAAGGVHFIHYEARAFGATASVVRRTPSAVAGRESKGADDLAICEVERAADKWTESIDLADITYDSMRLYLMEIGRVNLLTKKQEQTLARQIEEWKHLEAVQKQICRGCPQAGSSYGRVSERMDVRSSPDTANRPTGAHSGCRLPLQLDAMRISETLTDVLIDEELSERIDGVLPEEMLLFAYGGDSEQGA